MTDFLLSTPVLTALGVVLALWLTP